MRKNTHPPRMAPVYAVNEKAKGKTHRVIKQTALLPRGRQRVHCGWRITKATSMVFWSSEVKDAAFCRKCFPYLPPAPRQNEESIEDFKDEEAAPVQ